MGTLVHGETIIVGYMGASLAGRGVLVVLSAAAPSLLPVGPAGVGALILVVPSIDDYTGEVAPLSINALVRWGICK